MYSPCGGGKSLKTRKLAWVHIDFMQLFTADKVYDSTQEHLATYLKFDNIVCVSDDAKKGFEQRFKRSFGDVLKVRYNVIDGESIITKAQEKCDFCSSAAFNIVCVGNMRHQKAYDRLLPICKRLKKEGLKFHVTIIGGGSEYAKVKDLVDNLELKDYITLLGNQSNPYKFMKHADLFLLASYTEGFSTVLIESIFLGIPAMVTQCAGMNEILDNGKYGIIIPNDEKSIEKNLRDVILCPTLLDKYKSHLPERAKFFDKNQAVRECEQLFE